MSLELGREAVAMIEPCSDPVFMGRVELTSAVCVGARAS